MVDLIGTECGVERHVQIFKEKGIWIEDGTITPEPGYIIVFNWGKDSQPNDGFSDHIGVVDSVKNGTITCIEGNRNDAVSYRSIPVGWGKSEDMRLRSTTRAMQFPPFPEVPPARKSDAKAR